MQLKIRPEKYQTKYQKTSQRASRTNQTRQKFFFICRPIVLFKKFKIIFFEHPGFLLGWIAEISRLGDAVKIPYWDFWADLPSFFLVEIILLLRSRSLQDVQELLHDHWYFADIVNGWQRLMGVFYSKITGVIIFITNWCHFFTINKNELEIENISWFLKQIHPTPDRLTETTK